MTPLSSAPDLNAKGAPKMKRGMLPLSIIKHCAQECEYQRSGEKSVYNMCKAWVWATDVASRNPRPGFETIKFLGKLVEPQKNRIGFRVVGVRVGPVIMPKAELVPGMVQRLCDNGEGLTPAEFFKEFEEIHPFVDGNGRVGNILFNWLQHTLPYPEMPPDFWQQNRLEGPLA